MASVGPRFPFVACSAFALAVLVAGCSARQDALTNVPAPTRATSAPATLGGNLPVPDFGGMFANAGRKPGHPYFPIRPGEFRDYRVTRLGVGVRYVRVTVGEPESFFGRMPTPFVYGDVPGQVRDSTLYGLRQYYSYSPDGDVWFHGAQNNGFMSHTEPPVRQLRAQPVPGETWADTVLFESFFPGMDPFVQATYIYTWTLSEPWKLVLEGGVFRALRVSVVIDELPSAVARGAMHTEASLFGPASPGFEAFRRLGMAPRPDPLQGPWYSRHDGMVARDWPSGQGEVQLNAVTFELIGRGTGPLPPPPPPPGTQ